MSIVLPQAYGNIATYRFYVVISPATITQEVFPLNFLSTSLIDEQEGNNAFYRRVFNGSLLFGTNSLAVDDSGVTVNRKDDWTYFWDIEQNSPCTDIDFLITKTVSGVTTTYWEGYFSTSDGRFDIDKCTFEVTPLVYDDYTDLLDKEELQHNILSVAPIVTTQAFVPTVMNVTYTRNRWLVDVIEYLAADATYGIIPGATVSCTFFTAVTNYVTLAANTLNYLTIAQKSDIIRPASSNPATTAMMSWKELMDILWGMFQVQWNYDFGTNTINVEHCSWVGFTPAAGIDLRTQISCEATNKYSYLKEKMPMYEKFSFQEADDSSFIGVPIYYNSPCVDQNPKTNVKETTVNVTTDLQYIYQNPDAISDEGFVIFANYLDGGNYYVSVLSGKYTPAARPNLHLSWANLQNSYFRHERVLITGYLNGVLETFWSALKTKAQECTAIICDAFDPTEEITTELGETYFAGVKARVHRAELFPTGSIKFNLLYGPDDNVNTGPIWPKILSMLSDATDIYCYLSEVNPFDTYIWIYIDATTCQEIIIPSGTTYFTVALSDTGPLEFNLTDESLVGWFTYWNGDPVPISLDCPAVPPAVPAAPVIASVAQHANCDDVIIMWNTPANATYYKLARDPDENMDPGFGIVFAGAANSYVDEDAGNVDSVLFTYKVLAGNISGESAYSATDDITTNCV
jgi:hypothetical protein